MKATKNTTKQDYHTPGFDIEKIFTEEHIKKAVENRMKNEGGRKPVSCYKLDGTFVAAYESGTHAEQVTGINKSHISRVCHGKQKTTGGFKWEFTDN